MSYETIRYQQDGHVAVLTYDRPEQRNAVSRQMNVELHDAWGRFRDDDEAFVLVLTGARGMPSALAGTSPTRRGDHGRRLGPVPNPRPQLAPGDCGYTRRTDVFKPVIAAVNGWAVAAGLETHSGRHPDRRRERRLRRLLYSRRAPR